MNTQVDTIAKNSSYTLNAKNNEGGQLKKEAEFQPNFIGKAFDDIKYIGRSIVSKDKGYAFRQSVDFIKDLMLKDAPENVAKIVSPKICVVTRFIQTVLDAQLAYQTWQNPESTIMDKVIDTGHVLTDICGIAGIFMPGIPLLTAVAYLGDIGAVGYHLAGMFDGGGGMPPMPGAKN